jgi:N-acetylmuramoyl-L-alanine amidase
MSATLALAAARPVILLDPGHGGHDSGARVGGVYEKHLNLDLAIRVGGYLQQRGYVVRTTRASDVFIPLAGRAAMANRYRDAVVVSLHFNWTHNSRIRGVEAYHTGSSQGTRLASSIQRSILRATRAPDRGVRTRHFYVLRNTRHPAVLVEGGFLSNPLERRLLCTGPYRDRLARSIAEGIMRGL